MSLSREDQLEAIEKYYRQKVAGTKKDEEELAIALALLEAAERGHVPNDAGTRIIVLQAHDVPPDADFLVDEPALRKQELRRVLPIVAILLLAFVGLLFAYGDWGKEETDVPTTAVHRPGSAPGKSPRGSTPQASLPVGTLVATFTPTPDATNTPTPTPTATATPTPSPAPTDTPTPLPPEEIEVKPEPVKLEADAVIPVSLEIAGRYYPIVPTGLRELQWAYVTDPAQVSWLAGSYVNIVLGLPYSPDNLDLVSATLAISDTLVIRNNVAAVNAYTVVDRRLVSVYEIETFGQRQAGLTLVLLGGNGETSNELADQRLVIQAIPKTDRPASATASGREVTATKGN